MFAALCIHRNDWDLSSMLAPRDKLTICFAHSAYRMAEQFARRDTGITHFQVGSLDEIGRAHV